MVLWVASTSLFFLAMLLGYLVYRTHTFAFFLGVSVGLLIFVGVVWGFFAILGGGAK